MSIRDVLALEFRVAFSPTAQPVWVRVVKWIVILTAAVYFRDARHFWWWVIGLFVLAMSIHLVWRARTKRWTQPWFGWHDVEAVSPWAQRLRDRDRAGDSASSRRVP
jgi:hypothetical protein